MHKRRAIRLLRERFRFAPSTSCHHHHLEPSPVRTLHSSAGAASSSSSPGGTRAPNHHPKNLWTLFMEHRLWSSGASDKNKGMVEQLQRYGVIKSSKVAEVMETIDRGLFVPPSGAPYVDSPMPIGYSATISAPHMHAACLELLKDHLQPGMRALDVGSGTGYLTACFALMVGPEGRAVGVEHIPELVASSTENIKKSAAAPQLDDGSLSIHIAGKWSKSAIFGVADGREGWPELAPYDSIHVGAAAPQIPEALIEQLKPGGRMVIPVGTVVQELKVVDKKLDGSIAVRDETSVRYVPLTSKDAQLHAN